MLWAAGAAIFCTGLLLCGALTPAVRRSALARGFVDRPGGHKGHREPVALGGGLALVAAVVLPILVGSVAVLLLGSWAEQPRWLPPELAGHLPGAGRKVPQLGAITLGALVLMVVGLLDDRRALPAGLRFAVHLGVALLVWLAGVRVTAFLPLPGASLVLTLVWVAGITNAFNMLDHADGLACGVALIAALVLTAALATPPAQLFIMGLLLLVAGAAAGFLLHNRPPARIYMGDAGSTVLGYLLGVATALATFYGEGERTRAHAVAVPLLVLAVPLYDMASVVLMRLRLGRSPFAGDRNHFTHRLLRLGLSPRAALGTVMLVTLATGLGALLVDRVSAGGAVLLLVQAGLLLGIIAVLEVAAARAAPREDQEPSR